MIVKVKRAAAQRVRFFASRSHPVSHTCIWRRIFALTDALLASGVSGLAYETVQLADGRLPLLEPMSEVAGRMAAQIVSHYLERHEGGRGTLMGRPCLAWRRRKS